jgi:hypothetical protein
MDISKAPKKILQESISDSDSDDDSDKPPMLPIQKPPNVFISVVKKVTSPQSNAVPRSVPPSVVDTLEDDGFEIVEDSYVDLTGDVSCRKINASNIKALASASYKQPVQPLPFEISEQVPLRQRAYSDLNDTTKAMEAQKALKTLERETPERWRGRLWPGKALMAYCRVITRCQPPQVVLGEKVRLARGKLELTSHWKASDIGKIGTSFPSLNAHSTSFFLLTVEESREAVNKSEDIESSTNSDEAAETWANNNAVVNRLPPTLSRNAGGSNGWMDCEVVNIVAESELSSMKSAYDVRLGSVWVVKVAIRTPNIVLDESITGPNVRKPVISRESALAGGDLIVLHNSTWSKPLLGIVQPWDPDYDIKFGINFQLNPLVQQSMLAECVASGETRDLTTANLLICVDGGDLASREAIGGWASPGTIHPGVVFKIALLGNVMTYMRECQALMSLKLLNPSLRDAVLNQEGKNKICYVTDTLSPDDSGPFNVPSRLWKALKTDHNESQLRALQMVCKRDAIEDMPASPICLLQGPPGTGTDQS